ATYVHTLRASADLPSSPRATRLRAVPSRLPSTHGLADPRRLDLPLLSLSGRPARRAARLGRGLGRLRPPLPCLLPPVLGGPAHERRRPPLSLVRLAGGLSGVARRWWGAEPAKSPEGPMPRRR